MTFDYVILVILCSRVLIKTYHRENSCVTLIAKTM